MQKWNPLSHQTALLGIFGAGIGGMGVILGADFIYGTHFCQKIMEMHHSNGHIFVNFDIEMHHFAKLMPKSYSDREITSIYAFLAKSVHLLIHFGKN